MVSTSVLYGLDIFINPGFRTAAMSHFGPNGEVDLSLWSFTPPSHPLPDSYKRKIQVISLMEMKCEGN